MMHTENFAGDQAPPPWAPPERLEHSCAALGIRDSAQAIFRYLAQLDGNPSFRAWAEAQDEDRRSGVLSYMQLGRLLGGVADGSLDSALRNLCRWGVAEVVGERESDPRVGGSAAVRLTSAGRIVAGLAPPLPAVQVGYTEGLVPWMVLHGELREALCLEAYSLVDTAALDPQVLPASVSPDWLTGQVAAQVAWGQPVVWDACHLEAVALRRLASVIQRTGEAPVPRILLATDPSPFRLVALTGAASLRWVGLTEDTRAETGTDERLTRRLVDTERASSRADVCGLRGGGVARAIRREVPWEQLIVPAQTRRQLELVRLHGERRLSSPGDRPGYRLLLSGLPGTGKTLAASALATASKRLLLKLDMSMVLSRWLGETEKHLGEVFDRAEASDAVLLLDEAESLLRQREGGERSSGLVTTVAYLLSRIDDYRGLLVATTNRVSDFDEAFYRRFDDYVVLPVPDAEARARMWGRFLGKAGGLDLVVLGRDHVLTGGLIEGAATRARAWAEGLDSPLTETIVLASVLSELEKAQQSGAYILGGPQGEAVEAFLGREVG